jgi:hypothetical protein
MKYYFLLLFAVIIGQTFLAAVSAWVFQKGNDNIDYPKALQLYFKKEMGTFFVILTFTLMLMFVLSDWMDLATSRTDLIAKGALTKFEQAQKNFRTVAVVYGVFAQWIAFLFYKGGKNAIEKYGKERGVNINEADKN